MTLSFILIGFLIVAFLMTVAKRITALISVFRIQSFFLFLYTFYMGFSQRHLELLIVCGLVFIFKVLIIPFVLLRIMRRIKVEEDLGLLVNPQLSLVIALILTYFSYLFAHNAMSLTNFTESAAFVVSIATVCIGFFIMVSRMKALGQIIGLLVMENGIFLAAGAIAGGMPFFVEIALFFDVFVFVIIIEIFVYKVNRLFTHIDTSKMQSLKG
jgi:hydrogenase-4 component E